MNISYNWLKDLIDTELSPEERAKPFTHVAAVTRRFTQATHSASVSNA